MSEHRQSATQGRDRMETVKTINGAQVARPASEKQVQLILELYKELNWPSTRQYPEAELLRLTAQEASLHIDAMKKTKGERTATPNRPADDFSAPAFGLCFKLVKKDVIENSIEYASGRRNFHTEVLNYYKLYTKTQAWVRSCIQQEETESRRLMGDFHPDAPTRATKEVRE